MNHEERMFGQRPKLGYSQRQLTMDRIQENVGVAIGG